MHDLICHACDAQHATNHSTQPHQEVQQAAWAGIDLMHDGAQVIRQVNERTLHHAGGVRVTTRTSTCWTNSAALGQLVHVAIFVFGQGLARLAVVMPIAVGATQGHGVLANAVLACLKDHAHARVVHSRHNLQQQRQAQKGLGPKMRRSPGQIYVLLRRQRH
jgi:hypothetical protein